MLHQTTATEGAGVCRCAPHRLYGIAISLLAAGLATDSRASAPEYLADDQPAPASVEDELSPMEEVVPIEVPLPSVFPRLKRRLERAAPFWRDSQLREPDVTNVK